MLRFIDNSIDVKDSGAITRAFVDQSFDDNHYSIYRFIEVSLDKPLSIYRFIEVSLDIGIGSTNINILRGL